MTRNAIWNGTYFSVINQAKTSLWKPESKSSEMLRNFVAGFFAGTLATTFNTPFDVVKSRNQNLRTGTAPWSVPGVIAIYQKEGFKALFKGYVPRIMRLGPGGGIMIVAFDFISGLLSGL